MDDRIAEIREALDRIGPLIDGGYGTLVTEDSPLIEAARKWLALLDSDALIIRRDKIDYEAAAREMFGDFDVAPAIHAADLRQAQRAVDAALASSQGVETNETTN